MAEKDPSPAVDDTDKADVETTDASAADAAKADTVDKDTDTKASDNKEAAATPPRRRWLKRLGIGAGVGALSGLLLWGAVHRIPWLGPMLADGLRSVIGVEAVTKLEDFAYGMQDRFNRTFRGSAPPKAYWKVPNSAAAVIPSALPSADAGGCAVPPFAPSNVGPVHQSWFAPGDGTWIPIEDSRHAGEAPRMYKTLLHPDKNRSWAAVTVVAVDRRTVDLHPVLGRYEPKAETKEAKGLERPGLIKKEHHESLLAAFNGGFKAQHGHYGMRVNDVTIIRPRVRSCWIAALPQNKLFIGDWEKHEKKEPSALWWRQTPACMVEAGKLHPGLVSEKNTLWGATLDRNTVIRRSAIGVSEDGMTLYSGIGDSTTARAMAAGMLHAGAKHVAQLDVNWSYPKFVVFQPKAGEKTLVAEKIAEGFEFSEDEYIRKRAQRDFFYLTRKDDKAVEEIVCGGGKSAAPASSAPASSASAATAVGSSTAASSASPTSSAAPASSGKPAGE